jgi:hypothetical protein
VGSNALRRARIGLLALAASVPLLARGAPAPEASTTTAKTADACAVPAPKPLLKKADYADYIFEPGPDNTASEEASTGTVHIVIQSAGCRDGFEHSFVFVEDKPLASFDDRDHWLAFASDQLQALHTYRRGREDIKDLLEFLAGAKIATTRMNDSELRLEVCRDGSPTTEDGCSLKSGGGWRFAVRVFEKSGIQVYVSRYMTLPPPRSAVPAPSGPLPQPK